MEAMCPCIGLDSKNSGLPAIYFSFTLTNTTDADVDATLMMSQQNLAGWNGSDVIVNEVENAGYGANLNAKMTLKNMTAIDMSKTSLRVRSSAVGKTRKKRKKGMTRKDNTDMQGLRDGGRAIAPSRTTHRSRGRGTQRKDKA